MGEHLGSLSMIEISIGKERYISVVTVACHLMDVACDNKPTPQATSEWHKAD